MAKKKTDKTLDSALSLGRKSKLTKKDKEIDVKKIEEATNKIHTEGAPSPQPQEESKPAVKKTSIHLPLDLYTKLKTTAFQRGITLRKLIVQSLEEKFKD